MLNFLVRLIAALISPTFVNYTFVNYTFINYTFINYARNLTNYKMISITIFFLVSTVSADDCLEAHNNYRRQHRVPPLRSDGAIISFAQSRATDTQSSESYLQDMGKICA